MTFHRSWKGVTPRSIFCLLGAFTLVAGCTRSPEQHLRAAQELLSRGDPYAAARHYRLARTPGEGISRAGASRVTRQALWEEARVRYLDLRQPARAAALYRELIDTFPDAPEALHARVQLADILRTELKDVPGAVAQLQGALAQHPPQAPMLRYELAKIYFQAGDYSACAAQCETLLEAGPDASLLAARAGLLRAQAVAMIGGRASEAIRLLEELAERFPLSELSGLARHELGRLQAEAGLLDSAIEQLVHALKTHPYPSVVQAAIGIARRRLEGDASARARLARMQLAAGRREGDER